MLGLLAGAWAGLGSGPAIAQPVAVELMRPADATGLPVGLQGRLGLAEGRDLLFSLEQGERLRGVERLATLGTPEAIETLLDATENGSPLTRDPLVRLAIVRALGVHAGKPRVRALLVREMMDAGGRRDVASAATTLVRETAALALARQGDRESVEALVSAAMLRGQAGDAARGALATEPPRSIDALLFEETEATDEESDEEPEAERPTAPARGKAGKASKFGKTTVETKKPTRSSSDRDDEKGTKKTKKTPRVLTPSSLSLLGELGDLRAIPSLRAELERSDRPSRAAAALALAKLGDASILPVVRTWGEESDPRFVLASAEVLAMLGDPGADKLIERCLGIEAVRAGALKLAGDVASPGLVKPLAKLLPSLDPTDRVRALAAIGRAGAAAELEPSLADKELAPAAIVALGTSPSPEAGDRIAAALAGKEGKDAVLRRALVRAALLRVVAKRERVEGLGDTLRALAASKDASDVELGAFARVLLNPSEVGEVLGADPPLAVVSGAARAALLHPTADTLRPFAPLLRGLDPEKPSARQIASGVALLAPEAASTVPFDTLLRLAEGGGPLASLAARALPARATDGDQKRLSALLFGSDASVRVALALGLAEAPSGGTASRLGRAYEREDDVLVRRALITALARRPERQAARTLELASRLDPDATVRAIASSGLVGERASTGTSSDPARELGLDVRAATFFSVVDAGGTARTVSARVVLPSGMAIPVVTAEDGGLLLGGLPFGRSSLELAVQPEPDHRPGR